ncbi:MAG: D-alanine--D-alanine ligase [Chloroflexota bacterium]|jgi:D-alanine-D-alanine ligase
MSGKQQRSKDKGRKLRVGIIFGGRSGEHEVSLMSARSVMAALNRDKYEIEMIGITRTGKWLTGNVAAALEDGLVAEARPATLLPDPDNSTLMQLNTENRHVSSLSEVATLDIVFPVLHGPYGEDGTVQGLLELAGIPYVGAGVVGSAVGMDKAIFKAVMVAHGLPVLPWVLVLSSEWFQDQERILQKVESTLEYPVFTKPANLGSSVGICRCTNRSELVAGLDDARRYDRRLIVEQGVDGRELEVSVLGNDHPIASVVGEIKPRRTFYDYVAKYISDDSELIIPAELDLDTTAQIQQMAVQAFQAIDGAGLARVDFLLDKDDGRIYINELNTIPGFTRISMYPKLWEASGISYPELLDRLIELALERSEVKSKLKTTYEIEDY